MTSCASVLQCPCNLPYRRVIDRVQRDGTQRCAAILLRCCCYGTASQQCLELQFCFPGSLDLPLTLLYGLKSDAAQSSRESSKMGPMGRMVMSHARVGRKTTTRHRKFKGPCLKMMIVGGVRRFNRPQRASLYNGIWMLLGTCDLLGPTSSSRQPELFVRARLLSPGDDWCTA